MTIVFLILLLLQLLAYADQDLNFESARYQPKFPKPRGMKTNSQIAKMFDQLPLTDAEAEKTKLYVIPSYPTSGSMFVRRLFSLATDISMGTLKKTKGNAFFGKIHDVDFYVDYPYPPPFNTSTLFKIHYPVTNEFHTWKPMMHKETWGGIVMLVRNPGDCLLRNAARWACRNQDNCRTKKETQICSSSGGLALDQWIEHQQYWLDVSLQTGLPLMVVRYEEAMKDARRIYGYMCEFMGLGHLDSCAPYIDWAVAELQVEEHTPAGHVMKSRGCSLQFRRKVDNTVGELSRLLGYDFDENEGVWSLSQSYVPFLYPVKQ
jgi:hypothetical protein